MAPLASIIDTCIQDGREQSGLFQTCDQKCLNKITTCVLSRRSELTDRLCENDTSMAVLKTQMNQMQFEIDSVRNTFVKKGDIDTSAFALKSDLRPDVDVSSLALKSDLKEFKTRLDSDLDRLRGGLDTSSFARTNDLNEMRSELTKMVSDATGLEGLASKSDLDGLASRTQVRAEYATTAQVSGLNAIVNGLQNRLTRASIPA